MMKPREQRVKCVVIARMRLNQRWNDVCIRNISTRGLLIQAAFAPPRGTYVEVCRGHHTIVARVVWAKNHRFGIQTQERLNPEALLKEPNLSAAACTSKADTRPPFDRRKSPRPSQADIRWKAEQNRFLSQALQFACIGALGASAALLIFDTVSDVLSQPATVLAAELRR